MTPSPGANWKPPACWYEPKYTPEEFSGYSSRLDHRTGGERQEDGGLRGKYGDFHVGDKGEWYIMRYNDDTSAGTPKECLDQNGYVFIGPGNPAPEGAPVLDPEILAGLAYEKTRLPAPPLTLEPKPGHQVVNLPTHARFTKQLDPVWVTAGINEAGLDLAATTVAKPAQLRLEAGADDAKPATCTYDLTAKGGTYAVNTENADCNITYRRATSKQHAPALKAYLTWKVTWHEGEGPEGAPEHPMPDGESVAELPVTVKEIQSINRD